MSRGIFLIAFGNPCYGMAAWNLAVSIKHHSPDLPIFLMHDERVFSKGYFDLGVFDERKVITPDYSNPASIKTSIYNELPFDENLFLDVDAICLKDINPLFDKLKGKDYAVHVLDTYDINSPEQFPNMYWADKSVIWEHYNLSKEAKLPATQSSVQYIRKCDASKKIFEQLNSNLRNPIPLNKLRNQWGGSQPDELYLNIALAQLNVNPPIGDEVLFFANQIAKDEKGKVKGLSQVQSEYYFLSLFGGRNYTRPMYQGFYDRLMIEYCRKRGVNHRYKINYVLTNKHADKPQVQFKAEAEKRLPVIKSIPVELHKIKDGVKINLFISWYNPKDERRANELLKILDLNKGANRFLVSEHPFNDNIPQEVVKIKIESRPTYNDMFRIADKYADENTISIIANADIEFDSLCLKHLSEIDYRDKALALTRWEKSNGRIITTNGLTQDAWVFKGKAKSFDCDIELGKPGCDHVIAYAMNDVYDLRNPSLDLKIWHYDSEKTYTQQDRIRGAYLAVRPERLNDLKGISYSLPSGKKKKLLILQPGHFGDIIICLPIAKHYSKDFDVYWYCPKKYHELFRNVNYVKPTDKQEWYGQGRYDMILDLSFGLSQGSVEQWWKENMGRFKSFVEAKYELANVDVRERWNLDIRHDKNKEISLYKLLGLEGKKYALCHEQSDYEQKVEFDTTLTKVLFKPIRGYTIFDWYHVIINATEIHCIDSSLANYVEVLPELKGMFKQIAPGINSTGVCMSIFENGWTPHISMKLKLASDISKEGISIGDRFKDEIKKTISQYKPKLILETGTYLGNGTTRTILDAIQENNLNCKVVSIECNPEYAKQAKKNLQSHPQYKNLEIINGLSIPKSLLPENISYENLPANIIVDHYNANEYLKEVKTDREDLIREAVEKYGEPDMVVLDSAGHMGTIEFKYLLSLVNSDFILAIDDTKHLKHYKTLEIIKEDESFELITEGDEKFGFAIAKHTAKELV